MEQIKASQRGKHLHEVANQAVWMIAERINLQEMGLSVFKKLPLCDPNSAKYIENFFPRAKDGFTLALKSEQVTKLQFPDLLKEADNTLPEFNHVRATAAILSKLGKVSYDGFIHPPKVPEYLEKKFTYWYKNIDISGLWELMVEIGTITHKALYQPQAIPIDELLRAGHFYTASEELSNIF